jgi:hypothetical protein
MPKKKSNDNLKVWENRAKQVYQESLKIFREGFHGLEVITGRTVEVGKIKIANQQAVNRIRNLFADLGQRVYETVTKQRQDVLRITPDIKGFVLQIKKVQHFVEDNVKKLRHMTTADEMKKKPARRSPAKKKAVAKKPVRRKPAKKKK